MGLYISNTMDIEFFRQACPCSPPECTGVVADCAWANGGILTPCIAFRDPGDYQLRIEIVKVSQRPPQLGIKPDTNPPTAWKPMAWTSDDDESDDDEQGSP